MQYNAYAYIGIYAYKQCIILQYNIMHTLTFPRYQPPIHVWASLAKQEGKWPKSPKVTAAGSRSLSPRSPTRLNVCQHKGSGSCFLFRYSERSVSFRFKKPITKTPQCMLTLGSRSRLSPHDQLPTEKTIPESSVESCPKTGFVNFTWFCVRNH